MIFPFCFYLLIVTKENNIEDLFPLFCLHIPHVHMCLCLSDKCISVQVNFSSGRYFSGNGKDVGPSLPFDAGFEVHKK